MRLTRATISNYRCLQNVSVDMSDLTVLLGPNSAGKSSFLHALAFFFEGDPLEPEDVFAGGEGPVSVECTFGSLTVRDRDLFGPYAEGGQMVLRKTCQPGEGATVTGRGRQLREFDAVRAATGGARTQTYRALREGQPELELPDARNIAAVDQAMLTWEQEHPDRCEIVETPEAGRLFGFGSVGKARLADRFQFVLVPALRDAAAEVSERKGTLLSRLLTAVAGQRAAADDELQTIADEARAKYDDALVSSHGPVLAELGARVTAHVRRYVPAAEIRLDPVAAGFHLEPPRVDLRAGEGQDLTDLARQGHGFQRAFLISVLEYLAETAPDGDEDYDALSRPTLLLGIEEPELYQHPPRARHFYRTLSRISDEPSVQVCYATHSPYFVSADRFDALRIFRRDERATGRRGTAVTAARIDAVKDQLPESREPRTYLRRTLSEQFREAFFATGVLLAEGVTDAAIFDAATELLGDEPLNASGIVTTNVGGKSSQPVALAILRALGIPTYCVFDGDADATDGTKCDACGRVKTDRQSAKVANQRILRALRAEESDFPATTVDKDWACFHTEIEDAIPGLRDLLSEVSREMGWSGKSPEAYTAAMLKLDVARLPSEIGQILQAVRDLAGPGTGVA